ncbi:MAG: aldehyde dehydrogenase family protein [Idiomarina sp.]|nr:aldehyde dehydrogenase family protein [Idiomarina sp.]
MSNVFKELYTSFQAGVSRHLQWRINQLNQLEALLVAHTDELLTALAEDLGKSATEAFSTEVGFLLKDIRYTRKHLRRWARPQRIGNPLAMQPAKAKLVAEPLGVVLVFGAWNYPLQLSLSPVIAALAAGNCVCLKPSEVSPATSAIIAKLIPQYLDEQCIAVVEGDAKVAQSLLHEPFHHIFYTGGGGVGKHVMRAAAENLTPVTLELGGKSPVIVSEQTDLQVTARRIVWGKFMNAGQTCIAPDYVLVNERVHDQLVEALKVAIHEFYGRDPQQSDDYGRIVADRHMQRLLSLISEDALQGATLWGGDFDRASGYFSPTLVTDCKPNSPIMEEEIFGPILPILKVRDLESAVAFVAERPHPLACYLFSNKAYEHQQVERHIHTGTLCINDTMVFMLNPKLPFGGVGASGMGRYHGKYGFDTFTHRKPVVTRSFWFDLSVRYPPYTSFKQKLLRKLLG